MAPTRVLVVEDNQVFRSSLELLLDLQPEIEVVGAVADAGAALDACRSLAPDVVLMDYRLPDMDGAEATAALLAACPAAAVVCLTAEATAGEREAVRRAGAVALVAKGGPVSGLAGEILRAAGRGTA